MNKFIIIAALAAMAYAAPTQQGVSLTQDTLGNYNLKFSTDEVDRNEQGFEGGKVVGSYSYTDKEGQHHKVTYVAAPDTGFVAHGDLPQSVQETPEVLEARRSHLAIVAERRALLPALKEEDHVAEVQEIVYVPVHHEVPVAHTQTLPIAHQYVDNTAELEAAKAEHFAAHQHALATLAEEYRRVKGF